MSRYCKHGIDPRNCSECPDRGMSYMASMATEGGRKCPMCGRYAKKGTVGNLSFTADIGGGYAHISMYGHLHGHGCNISDNVAPNGC
jgi:hypothetical protein